MTDQQNHQTDDAPTQTTPEGVERERLNLHGKGGTVIPVPAREQVFGDFEKVAKAKPPAAEPGASERESGPEE